ncbi:MAG: methyltransferase RsmF C-terminal domain-like protein, partial [Flavitalea sp.]
IIPAIKENGVLIYSTCSYSIEEDELIADWLVNEFDMEPLSLNVKDEWKIVESKTKEAAFGYRFYPDKLKGEGFFISCFRKKQDSHHNEGASNSSRKSSKLEKVSKNEIAQVREMVNTDGLLCWKLGERILAIPEVHEKLLGDLMSGLYIRNAGISLGKPSAKELIPDHELAMSTITKSEIARIELKKEDALQYLRREEVKLDGNTKGWAMATFQNLPLGWMKLLSNRINNYYPKEWRILKSASN